MNKIEHADKIFKLMKQELKKYDQPIVSRPKREIENTPFVTLISCILSLRTKDEVTEQASIRLLKKYYTPELGKGLFVLYEVVHREYFPVHLERAKDDLPDLLRDTYFHY